MLDCHSGGTNLANVVVALLDCQGTTSTIRRGVWEIVVDEVGVVVATGFPTVSYN